MSELEHDALPFLLLPAFVRTTTACRVDFPAILRELGVPTGELHPETYRLDVRARDRLFELCVERAAAGDSGLYFPFVFGDSFAFEYTSDIETFLTTSPTLRTALLAFSWMPYFIDPRMRSRLDEGPERSLLACWLDGVEREALCSRYLAEWLAGVCCRCGRLVNDGNTPALELHFHFPAPPHAHLYEAHYQLPVRFDQPETAVIIETALLDRPLQGAFPELNRQAADRVVSRLVPAPPQSALIAEIERAFAERPALLGLSIDAMAKRLGLSRRTLQRRLSAEGLSFSTLQARVRMSVAEEWLRTDELSIEEIGERLGFADRRSFSQAFTRATGSAPSLFRKHARGAR